MSTEKEKARWRAAAKRKRDRIKAAKGRTGESARTFTEPEPEGVMTAQPIRIGVVEETGAPSVAAPLHESATSIPEAGLEVAVGSTEPGSTTTTSEKTSGDATLTLDPKTCVQLTKGVFALASLFTKQEHWKATDEEIEPIAEPMARQLQRIPIIAALGQNAADLIILGSTLGTLVFLRIQETQRIATEEAERIKARRENIRDIRPGETTETFRSGELHQEVREPREPKPNLEMFRGA